jgi:hypothetical protein
VNIACTKTTETIRRWNKEEMGLLLLWRRIEGVCKEAERRSRNAQKRNGALKGYGAESIKGRRTESESHVCRRH